MHITPFSLTYGSTSTKFLNNSMHISNTHKKTLFLRLQDYKMLKFLQSQFSFFDLIIGDYKTQVNTIKLSFVVQHGC